MTQYIDKDAVIAEIDELSNDEFQCSSYDEATGFQNALKLVKDFIDTLEVKEVDLDEEADNYWETLTSDVKNYIFFNDFYKIAKHFFELGLNASNSITEVNLESLVRQVIGLYFESGKHYDNVIKEERKEHGGSDLAIKLLDGYIDAEELGIQYVLNKLNAQKGEEV